MPLSRLLGLTCFVVSSLFFVGTASATTDTPTPTNPPTPTGCAYNATIEVNTSATTVVVGDTVTVSWLVNDNGGCHYGAGTTHMWQSGAEIFSPSGFQDASFPVTYTALSPGVIKFNVWTNGWFFLGWGNAETQISLFGESAPVTVVTPTPSPTATNTPTPTATHVILDFETTGTEQCAENTINLTPKTDFPMYLYVENESTINAYDKDGNVIAELDVESDKISQNKASFNAFAGNTTDNLSLSGTITYDKQRAIKKLNGTFIRRGIINSCYASGKFVSKYLGNF